MSQELSSPIDRLDADERLRRIVEAMRSMSRQTDAQEVVHEYAQRMRWIFPRDALISLSRRELERPWYRITRNSRWTEHINPWKEKDRLPLLQGGLLADLIYGEEPVVLEDFEVSQSDPAAEYLTGYRLLAAVPHFHEGQALNMVVTLHKEPGAYPQEQFPELVLISNLFGRATQNLVLADELKAAYQALDREFKVVGDIQRALLPPELPRVPGVELAAYYQTSRRAGGDYYDFFALPDDCWGIFIADVSGHGTPAAVVMAILHTIAHSYPGPPTPPGEMLRFINEKLTGRFMSRSSSFVTALYAVLDARARTLTYASAGHNPPRLRRGDQLLVLDEVAAMPLGVDPRQDFAEHRQPLAAGDLVLLYTDGVTETFGRDNTMYGADRLDAQLRARRDGPQALVDGIVADLASFSGEQAASDDRTLIALEIK